MKARVCIEGINLEKLLRAAADAGIVLHGTRRTGLRSMEMRVSAQHMHQLEQVCGRYGWSLRETGADPVLRAVRLIKRRSMLLPAMALCTALVFLSSQMILMVRIENGGEYTGELRRFFREEGVVPGSFKAEFSLDELRAKLAMRLPGLAFAGLRYEGSMLVCDSRIARQGEKLAIEGTERDVVALMPGIVTHISAVSGTPVVEPGQAVRKGQVLIKGQERTQKGELIDVKAQGQVRARVFAGGQARTALTETSTVETGDVRMRVTLHSPWHTRVVRDAEPFASQDASVRTQPVVGLYLPLWREIETYAQTHTFSVERDRGDAASMAQGAAEEIAKKQCPYGALILDKWVNYSMIDNEFMYAMVVLEYETSIAGRMK